MCAPRQNFYLFIALRAKLCSLPPAASGFLRRVRWLAWLRECTERTEAIERGGTGAAAAEDATADQEAVKSRVVSLSAGSASLLSGLLSGCVLRAPTCLPQPTACLSRLACLTFSASSCVAVAPPPCWCCRSSSSPLSCCFTSGASSARDRPEGGRSKQGIAVTQWMRARACACPLYGIDDDTTPRHAESAASWQSAVRPG